MTIRNGPLHRIVSSLKTRKQRGHCQYCKIFVATEFFNQCWNKAFIIDECWGCNWRDFIYCLVLQPPWLNFQPTGRILRIFYPCGSCEIIERQNIWNPSSDEIRNVVEEPESENEERNISSLLEEVRCSTFLKLFT